ncbi:MAG: DUF1761 domain-containing protein [Candidatus Puniceispirillaceae bacterium]
MSGMDYLVLLGCAALWFILGALWYSPLLFAKPWMRALGKTQEELMAGGSSMAVAMSVSAFVCLMQAATVAFIITHFKIQSVVVAGMVGFLMALSFGFLAEWRSHHYVRRKITLIWIDKGYDLVAAPMVAVIIMLYAQH